MKINTEFTGKYKGMVMSVHMLDTDVDNREVCSLVFSKDGTVHHVLLAGYIDRHGPRKWGASGFDGKDLGIHPRQVDAIGAINLNMARLELETMRDLGISIDPETVLEELRAQIVAEGSPAAGALAAGGPAGDGPAVEMTSDEPPLGDVLPRIIPVPLTGNRKVMQLLVADEHRQLIACTSLGYVDKIMEGTVPKYQVFDMNLEDMGSYYIEMDVINLFEPVALAAMEDIGFSPTPAYPGSMMAPGDVPEA